MNECMPLLRSTTTQPTGWTTDHLV